MPIHAFARRRGTTANEWGFTWDTHTMLVCADSIIHQIWENGRFREHTQTPHPSRMAGAVEIARAQVLALGYVECQVAGFSPGV